VGDRLAAAGRPSVSDTAARLEAAVRRRFGAQARVENLERPTVGGSNQTVLFDVVEGPTRRRLVLRAETYTAPGSPFLDPAVQFRLLEVAGRHGVPVPEPMFLLDDADGLGRGFVMGHVDGETVPQRIQREPRFAKVVPRLAGDLGEILARLHAIPPAEVEFLDATPDSRDPVGAQRARYDSYDEPHPAIELGLRWLELHRRPVPGRALVHADFRNGNFIVTEAGVAAVLDWECTHLGDPMEDLAWLCLKSWRFSRPDRPVGGFGERGDLYLAYESGGGGRPDPEAIRYWEIFGFVRWAVLSVMQGHGHVFGGRASLVYAATARNTATIEHDLVRALQGEFD
jgi:aminoglycoside phosphotransferase (APT) family kinase protein